MTRMDDKYLEGLVLRFLAKEMLRDPLGFLTTGRWQREELLLVALVAEFCRSGLGRLRQPMISWRFLVRAKTQKWMAFAMCQATQTPT